MQYLKRLDWILNGGILFLAGAGLVLLASAAPRLAGWQLLWVALGFGVILFLADFDWRSFINYRWFVWGIYILAVLLLFATYFFAPAIRGVRGWLILGPFQFQTSEFAKVALIIVYASFFAKRHVGIAYARNLFLSFFYFLLPALLVFIQPDLGSVLILFGIWFGYLLVSGIRWKHILLSSVVFAAVFILLWFSVLKDYQRERIIGLFYPERDPFGINYSVIQSKIAIGSAGFWGKGFGQGTQSQLGFLPEAQTDFIFAAFVEEFGMLGGIGIIAAFLIVLLRIIKIGIESDNNFYKLICLGASILFLAHFVLNVGSNLGLLPVIGVSFPFLSYGGSNFIINSILIGMIQGTVIYRRF